MCGGGDGGGGGGARSAGPVSQAIDSDETLIRVN